jgi:hypothetical protein
MITDFKLFELKGSEKYKILYKDDNLTVVVVKSFDSCKIYGADTEWCSNYIESYYKHNETANMYRFIFSDGYKLRLTWDYIERKAAINSFSGGSHWGSGGIVNGREIPYYYIRPEDNNEPFLFYYNKNDERQELVDRIETIPQEVINIVTEYQNKHSLEKSKNLNIMYNEIKKINVISVNKISDDDGRIEHDIVIEYKYRYYKIKSFTLNNKMNIQISRKFLKKFNKYGIFDKYDTLDKYLIDKIKEFMKKNRLNENITKDKIITEEYIFYCGIDCAKDICDYDEGLKNFSDEDFQDYLNDGETWYEYYEYAIDHFDIEWETNSDGGVVIWTNVHNESILISDDGIDDDDFDGLRNLVTAELGLYFNIIENENHPNYIKKQQVKKFNL